MLSNVLFVSRTRPLWNAAKALRNLHLQVRGPSDEIVLCPSEPEAINIPDGQQKVSPWSWPFLANSASLATLLFSSSLASCDNEAPPLPPHSPSPPNPSFPLPSSPSPTPKISHSQYAANKEIEDRITIDQITLLSTPSLLVSVFDGHGGSLIAEYASKNLPSLLPSLPPSSPAPTLEELFTNAYRQIDHEIEKLLHNAIQLNNNYTLLQQGSCALSILIQPDTITTASLGDCKAILYRHKDHAQISTSFNANNVQEVLRLQKSHPEDPKVVINASTNKPPLIRHNKLHSGDACYVKGCLQPTRVFGDFYLKKKSYGVLMGVPLPHSFPYVSVDPEVRTLLRSAEDLFVVAGSDGLFDVLDEEEIRACVMASERTSAAEDLVEFALGKVAKENGLTLDQLKRLPKGHRRRIHDDISVVVVYLN